jgi:hypothetical protein
VTRESRFHKTDRMIHSRGLSHVFYCKRSVQYPHNLLDTPEAGRRHGSPYLGPEAATIVVQQVSSSATRSHRLYVQSNKLPTDTAIYMGTGVLRCARRSLPIRSINPLPLSIDPTPVPLGTKVVDNSNYPADFTRSVLCFSLQEPSCFSAGAPRYVFWSCSQLEFQVYVSKSQPRSTCVFMYCPTKDIGTVRVVCAGEASLKPQTLISIAPQDIQINEQRKSSVAVSRSRLSRGRKKLQDA